MAEPRERSIFWLVPTGLRATTRSERQLQAALITSLAMLAWSPAFADPDNARDASASATDASQTPDYNGLDYTRPQQSVEFRLRFEDSSSPSSQTDKEQLFLRYTTKVDLAEGWKLGLIGQLPFVDKQTTTSPPPSTANEAGLGDAFFQWALSHPIDAHWAYGFGARLVAPTASDSLGSGKWQIMPGFGVRYAFAGGYGDTYAVPILRWAVSFAGDPSRRNIDEPQFAPTFNLGLPARWFVTLYPSNDIRINFGDPVAGQTGKLFLPFDAAIGRDVTDRITAYVEVGVPIIKDYPVYNFKTEVRVSVRF
jgi:hypothetical protein